MRFDRGDAVLVADQMSAAVWIVRVGSVGVFAGVGAERVIPSILRLGGQDGDVSMLFARHPVDGELSNSQATVAAFVGTRRPSVNKVVSELQRRRIIDVGYGSIPVLDATALLVQARRFTERPS